MLPCLYKWLHGQIRLLVQVEYSKGMFKFQIIVKLQLARWHYALKLRKKRWYGDISHMDSMVSSNLFIVSAGENIEKCRFTRSRSVAPSWQLQSDNTWQQAPSPLRCMHNK